MHAYKFETTVQEDGILNIPEIKKLVNHKIEIFIIDKSENTFNKKYKTFNDFSKKWAGFLKDTNQENWRDNRTNYLEEKYK